MRYRTPTRHRSHTRHQAARTVRLLLDHAPSRHAPRGLAPRVVALAALMPLALAPLAGAGPAVASPQTVDLITSRLAAAEIEVVPQAPTIHDPVGPANDTYILPRQDGIEWWVDGVRIDPRRYGTPIPTPFGNHGGQLTFTAKPTPGYRVADGGETEFRLAVDPPYLPDPVVTATLRDGWKAHVSWGLSPEDADLEEGITYTVTYQQILDPRPGQVRLGPTRTWFTDTTLTSGEFRAGYGVAYRITVVATFAEGVRAGIRSEAFIDVAFSLTSPPVELTDLSPATASLSRGWTFAPRLSEVRYFRGTALVTSRDGVRATWTVRGARTMSLFGTSYPAGGRALIQVDGRNWAWLDSGSPTVTYRKLLRTINLPSTGAHTVTVIASLPRGRELALDAYGIAR